MPSLVDILTDDDKRLGLLIVTVIVTVIIPFGPTIFRTLQTAVSRLYLQLVILPRRKNDTNDKPAAVVSGLFIHPVKSLRAVPVETATIDARGFVGDRGFMLVLPAPQPLHGGGFAPGEATHRFLTQRQCPSLATVVATREKNGKEISLSSHLLPKSASKITISTTPIPGAITYRAGIWSDTVDVLDMGERAAEFFQQILQQDKELPEEMKNQRVRLVAQAVYDKRQANDQFVPAWARTLSGEGPAVSLTDGFPILIACQASLDELNRRLKLKNKDPLPMSRFRPNIIITGTERPFEEDEWKVIAINDVLFHVVKGCPRCKMSCTDQTNGTVTEEPVATLAEFRALSPDNKDNVYFAQNACPDPTALGKTIAVGATVRVLQRGAPVWGD